MNDRAAALERVLNQYQTWAYLVLSWTSKNWFEIHGHTPTNQLTVTKSYMLPTFRIEELQSTYDAAKAALDGTTTGEPKPTWKNTFNGNLRGDWGWFTNVRTHASEAGYKYYTWNGWVYRCAVERDDGDRGTLSSSLPQGDTVCLVEELG